MNSQSAVNVWMSAAERQGDEVPRLIWNAIKFLFTLLSAELKALSSTSRLIESKWELNSEAWVVIGRWMKGESFI